MARKNRADRRKYHYLYRVDRVDGKFYVGMHSTDDLADGYLGSGKRITRSVRKHGAEKHALTILEFLPDREALREGERQLVTRALLADPMCMNIALGGGAGWELVNDDEALRARAYANREARLAELRQNTDWAKAKSAAQSAAQRATAGRRVFHGWPASASDAARSAEARAKRAATQARIGFQQGEKNSQHGSRWMHRDGAVVKVPADEVAGRLETGWSFGRRPS